MSDEIEGIDPALAKALLESSLWTRTPEFLHQVAHQALTTIAGMTTETESRIVNPDENGGRYELRTYRRLVTEWTPA